MMCWLILSHVAQASLVLLRSLSLSNSNVPCHALLVVVVALLVDSLLRFNDLVNYEVE